MSKPVKAGWNSRIIALLVSAVVLGLVFSRLNPRKLESILLQMNPWWFGLALCVNGFLFLPAAMRWHLVLKVSGLAVRFATTLRCVIIGHFFYIGLFGALGGDTARSVYYSKWFSRPLASVLATAPLDRLLGLLGLVLWAATGVILASLAGNSDYVGWIPDRKPQFWGALPLVLIVVLIILRFVARHRLARDFVTSLKTSALALMRKPSAAFAGVGCGFCVQAALSSVLALNLEAVAGEHVPWLKLAWTFPLISLMGGVPVTVAGLGTREAAAIGLLGLYGLTGETAMAASLLSLLSNIIWAVAAGALFWWQDRQPLEGNGSSPEEAVEKQLAGQAPDVLQ